VKRLTASKAENPIEVSLCFQALRRYVNKDSERLQLLSQSVMNVLKPSGAFAVLSYETADSDIIAAGVGERVCLN
jgi:16S rRNA C1402 N4-methylase RsmH